jgi:hypothetical protein
MSNHLVSVTDYDYVVHIFLKMLTPIKKGGARNPKAKATDNIELQNNSVVESHIV